MFSCLSYTYFSLHLYKLSNSQYTITDLASDLFILKEVVSMRIFPFTFSQYSDYGGK
jgi:hypothetical protein